MTGGEVLVRRDDARHRYEVVVDDVVLGHLVIEERPDGVVLVHTETHPEAQGQGLATRLVSGVLDDLRARGDRVIVQCPYVREFIDEHPEYGDLEVAGSS